MRAPFLVGVCLLLGAVPGEGAAHAQQDRFPVTPTLLIDGAFQGAEGIAFNGEGNLFVTANQALWRIDLDGNPTRLTDLHSNLGLAPIGERDLLVADFGPTNAFQHGPNDDGIVWRVTPEGEKTRVVDGGIGDPNALWIRPDGSFLVSDDAVDEIYLVGPDGIPRAFTTAVRYPNGILISPDNRFLYVAQIFESIVPGVFSDRVWRIPLDEGGEPAGEAELIGRSGEGGGPDGLVMDTEGRLYVSTPPEGRIWRFDPETGERVLIAEGMPGVASMAFGRGEFDHHAIYAASTRRGSGRIWKVDVGIGGIELHRTDAAPGSTPPQTQSPSPLHVHYVANAGVLVRGLEHDVLFDALFDRPNPAYTAPPAEMLSSMIRGQAPFNHVDLTLVTHNHPDHFRATVAGRFLLGNPNTRMIAPVDAVEAMRDSAADWERIAERVIPIDLQPGERTTRTVGDIRVHAFRTLHSGQRESPMNLMYLVEMDGRVIFHEGDSDAYHHPDSFAEVRQGGRSIDLALVHFWFPFEENGILVLEDILQPRHIGLIHLPIESEDFPPERFRGLDERFFLFRNPGEIWVVPHS